MVMDMDVQVKGGLWGYYRQPNGWITTAIVTSLEKMHYIEEGWQHLSQYGLVEMTTKYDVDHPFEVLFLQGGAKELPLAQIKALGLYIDPPLVPSCRQRLNQYHKKHAPDCWTAAKPVHFPQLEGLDLQPAQCRYCAEVRATPEGRDQHETVAHKEHKGEIRIGQTLAAALIEGLQAIPKASEGPLNEGRNRELEEAIMALRSENADLRAQIAPPNKPTKKTKRNAG